MVEIVDSVAASLVPTPARSVKGVWTGIARQAIDAHKRGEVLVVVLADKAEYKKMVNGMSEALRLQSYSRRFVTETGEDGKVKAWLVLEDGLTVPPDSEALPIRRHRSKVPPSRPHNHERREA
jgi:hypothetical protein